MWRGGQDGIGNERHIVKNDSDCVVTGRLLGGNTGQAKMSFDLKKKSFRM